jgi:hypothetical protein
VTVGSSDVGGLKTCPNNGERNIGHPKLFIVEAASRRQCPAADHYHGSLD